MRSRFVSPGLSSEEAALRSFDALCGAFYARLLAQPTASALESALLELDPDFELLSLASGPSGLCLDVRSDLVKRPLLERFQNAAPHGVDVVIERGPRSFEAACSCAAELGVDLKQARVRAGITRGHLLELLVYVPPSKGRLPDETEAAVELFVETCLGERVVDDWIKSIDVAPLVGQGPLRLVQPDATQTAGFHLSELKAALDCTVQGIHAQLPERPLCQMPERDDWVMLEAEPGQARARQADLVYASTCLPEMLKCFLEDAPFASVRFSRHAEHFAYLKYADAGQPEARVRARQLLEDRVDRALRELALGAVVGNGIGQHHSYIDLALGDVDRALGVLKHAAQACSLPTASWLLFCDTVWQLEWVGLRPQTEPPER